jgi:zinc protease
MFRTLRLAPCLAAALLVLSTPFSTAHAALDLAQPVPVGPQVTVGKLANGLTYYIHRNGKPAQRVELRLVVKAGSVLEDDDQQGLAHFAEHMAFNGSTHFKKHELLSYLQSIGVKFGADLNAYTSFDETVYILPVPLDAKGNLDQAFTVLEDWAHGLTFADADVDKERAIVLEEARLHKNVGERVNRAVMPRLLQGSMYAARLPIGNEDVVRSFSPDTLRRFYRDWYRPDLMAVVAVGDIDPAEVERLVVAHFAGLSNPRHERPRPVQHIAARAGAEALVVTDKELSLNTVSLRYPATPAPERGTWGHYRDKLVEQLCGAMLGQRLQERAQQPDAPFIGPASFNERIAPHYQAWYAAATLGARGAEPALAALVEENRRAREFGFSEAELAVARKQLLRRYESYYNERNSTNSSVYAAEYLRNFLHAETIPGTEAEYRAVQELAPAIVLDDVNAWARRTIPSGAGKLVVYTGAERAGTPAPGTAQLLAAVSGAEHATIAAPAARTLAGQLMEHPPQPGSIVAEAHDDKLGLTRLTLSNGVKVVLKPTDFRKDQVLLRAIRNGGTMLFDEKDIVNARYASTLAAIMGVKDYAPLDLPKILPGVDAGVSLNLGDYVDEVSGNAGSGADVETMLQLLWLRFAGVRRDDKLYQAYMEQQREMVRNRLAQPGARLNDALVQALYGGHPYAPRAITPGDVAQVSMERGVDIFRQRFASAKGLTFILVGNFDVASLKPLLATYLATLPTPDIPLAWRDVGLRPATGVVKREVHSGVDPQSVVSLNFNGNAAWSQDEWLRLAALMEVMNLRIVDVLREQQGLIYGGQMSAALERIPYGHYAVAAWLPTGPDKVDRVIEALFAEIARMQDHGPAQADLDKVKKNWHQSYHASLRENNYWVQWLEAEVFGGTDAARILAVDSEVDAITVADLRQAARRYLDTANYVQVVLYPEQQQPQTQAGAGAH